MEMDEVAYGAICLQEATGSEPLPPEVYRTPPPTPNGATNSDGDLPSISASYWTMPGITQRPFLSLLSPAGIVSVLMGTVGLFWIRP